MTTSDPGETPPKLKTGPLPPQSPPPTIEAGPLWSGLLLSLILGMIANIFSGVIGATTENKMAALLIGAVPGVIFMLASRGKRANGMAQGLLIGGCIVALIGGACGASMSGPTPFR